MPVDSTHPKYDANLERWLRCRDAVDGEDAVKRQGIKYLPKLGGQDDLDYEAYKMRASFHGASERTVKGLAGAIMRRDPEVAFPTVRKGLLDRLGFKGETFFQITHGAVIETLTTGRYGLLVDAPERELDENGNPVGEEVDPYVSLYFPENIINWKEDIVDGKREKVLVVLREKAVDQTGSVAGDDFDDAMVTQLRELRLTQIDGEWVYFVRLWQQKFDAESGRTTWITVGQMMPRMNGGRVLNRIPFEFTSPEGNETDPHKSPIEDLCVMNLAHYRNSADYEHGLHMTALPTPWVAGADPSDTVLRVGSKTAWVMENPQARAGMLEFTGEGLRAIFDAMEAKEKKMAVLGARLLEQQKGDTEAAETVRLRQAGEQSLLFNIVNAVSEAMTNVLRWVGRWIGMTNVDEIRVQLNTDFLAQPITPQMMLSLLNSLQTGAISFTVFFHALKEGEIYPDGWTEEDERSAIEAGLPGGGGQPGRVATPDEERELEQDEDDEEEEQEERTPEPAAA